MCYIFFRKVKWIMGFYIFGRLIPYYGLMIFTGIAAAALFSYIQLKKHRLAFDDFALMASFVGLGAMIGSKLLYIIVSWEQIDKTRLLDIEYINMLMTSGFVFYGGFIGGVAGVLICRKMFKINIFKYIEYCMPVIPIAHGFGRIGCHLAGCCYGIPCDMPFAKVYMNSYAAPNNVPLFPVQLTEAAAEFVIAFILIIYINAKKGKKHSLALYLLMYAPVRFLLEYVRYDEARGMLGCFSTSQWISIAMLLCALMYILYDKLYLKHQKTDNKEC